MNPIIGMMKAMPNGEVKKMKVDKRCLNCKHEGCIHERQGWGGDEYWCECKQGMSERDRRSFGCEKWEAK